MKRFELIAAQASAIAYVLAKRDSQEFARLLEVADVAMKTVIEPLSDADGVHAQSMQRWMIPVRIGARPCWR